MSLSSGRIVVTKFLSTGYKMLFLSFITLTRERDRDREGKAGRNGEESKSQHREGSVYDLMLTVHNELYDFE